MTCPPAPRARAWCSRPGTTGTANDLTLGAWDPVSRQPIKMAAVSVVRVVAGNRPRAGPRHHRCQGDRAGLAQLAEQAISPADFA